MDSRICLGPAHSTRSRSGPREKGSRSASSCRAAWCRIMPRYQELEVRRNICPPIGFNAFTAATHRLSCCPHLLARFMAREKLTEAARMHVYVRVCLCECVFVYASVCLRVCVFVNACVHMCVWGGIELLRFDFNSLCLKTDGMCNSVFSGANPEKMEISLLLVPENRHQQQRWRK